MISDKETKMETTCIASHVFSVSANEQTEIKKNKDEVKDHDKANNFISFSFELIGKTKSKSSDYEK